MNIVNRKMKNIILEFKKSAAKGQSVFKVIKISTVPY